MFILVGIFKIINYIRNKGKYNFYNYEMAYGIIAIILGLLTIYYSTQIGKIFRILIAVLMVAIGVVVVYKLIENSVTNREDFNFKVENITSNPVNTVNHEQNEHSFFGKVIESTDSYIIVEPNEDEDILKSSDKISISLGEYNDALYEVGTNVKITYDGTIMESYPAQVKATKIEVKSAEK